MENIEKIRDNYKTFRAYLDTLIIGEKAAKDVIAASILSYKNCHILLTGLPGTAKSTLSNALASNFDSKKIQITSDLLPIDIVSNIIDENEFNCLQLEELNRVSGRTQSALIELMAENKITVSSKEVYTFPSTYVIATQNNTEIAGIFDVPQAVYDRFDISVKLGNLTREEKEQVIFDYKPEKGVLPNIQELIDETTNGINNFVFSPKDREIIMNATDIIDNYKYQGKKLFATSNMRSYIFAKKLFALHAILEGKRSISASDIAEYLEFIYAHRINQVMLGLDNEDTKKQIENIKEKILEIKRTR